MKTRQIMWAAAMAMLVLGCAPSAEEIATMTAAAWTPTPAPSPTPTPIPYALTVHIADQAGAPLVARIVLPESGSDQPAQTDASGVYTWPSVNGPDANLQVSAPGFFAASQPVSMVRGPNELAVILQRDPLGLVANEACRPDEKLIYMDDFQNGKAADWRVTAGDPGSLAVAAGEEGNQILSMSGVGLTQAELSGLVMDNAVVRLRVQTTGKDGDAFINLKHFRAGGDTRYIFQWGANPFLFLTRFDGAKGSETRMSGSQFKTRPGQWYYLEISSYQGVLQAWADGTKEIEAQDPTPLPAGTVSLETHITTDASQSYLFDNMSICELTAPFTTSLYKPPSQ